MNLFPLEMPVDSFCMGRLLKNAEGGKVYVCTKGTPASEMTKAENFLTLYREEGGEQVPVSQPVILNQVGLPVVNGDVVNILCPQEYALAVYDTYGVQQFHFPDVLKDRLRKDLASPDGAKHIGSGNRTLLDHANDIKHSGDFSTLQAAVDASLKSTLLVSPGEYIENVTIGDVQLKGVGGAVVLKAPIDSTKVIQVDMFSPHWQFHHSGGFAIDGTGTTRVTGICFDPSNPYAGRHNFSDLYFNYLDKAIEKPCGNIGNTWRNIGVTACKYGYYAKSDKEMHCGADTLYNVHMQSISNYAVYMDASIGTDKPFGGGVGGWWLKDSIIEASEGGGVYIKNKRNDCPQTPCGLSNVWMEAIATAQGVEVDGVVQKPRSLKLIDTSIFFAEYTYINNIELSNSNLVAYGCRFDNADGNQDIVIDDQSTIVAYDTFLYGSSEQNVIVESVASQTCKIYSTNLSLRGNLTRGRLFNLPSGNKLQAITFDSGDYMFGGSSNVASSIVSDGIHSPTCAQFTFPSGGLYELPTARANIVSGRWYVWGVNSKITKGDALVRLTLGITLGSVYLKPGTWISTFGVAQAGASGVVTLYVSTQNTPGATINFSDYFVAEFSTQAEALAFANMRMALN